MISSENHQEYLLKNLTIVKDLAKSHKELLASETEAQCGILERLWVLAQRYSIVNKTGTKTLKLPFETIHPPENDIKAEFLDKICALQSSNLKLRASVENVRNSLSKLEKFLNEIGADTFTLLDDAISLQLPFSSCFEILQDLIKYFIKLQSQINCIALLIRPNCVSSVESYKKLLKPNRDFDEHFSQSLAMLHFLKKPN